MSRVNILHTSCNRIGSFISIETSESVLACGSYIYMCIKHHIMHFVIIESNIMTLDENILL